MASGRFRPGQSGNPGGRPREVAHVKELARHHTPEAIGTLVAIMGNDNEPAAARVRAAEALLDRGWGRAELSANVSIARKPREMTTEDLVAFLARHGVPAREEPDESER